MDLQKEEVMICEGASDLVLEDVSIFEIVFGILLLSLKVWNMIRELSVLLKSLKY